MYVVHLGLVLEEGIHISLRLLMILVDMAMCF